MIQKLLRVFGIMLFVIVLLFACTNKEINLITNVELAFTQENESEGLVQELLPTTLIITPEVFLPEFIYSFQYEVLEGDGVFLNSNEEALPAGEAIVLERITDQDTNFILNLNYKANNSGTHSVKVTTSDNFEKSFSKVLTYTIKDIPVVWEFTSAVTEADEQEEIPLSLKLAQKTVDPSITYQVRYTVEEGSGQLLDAAGNIISLNRLTPIIESTQNLTFISNQIGNNIILAELLDSNGQSIPTSIAFTILEVDREPPTISLIGTNPLVILTGSIYTDPGVTLTDNRDTALELQQNLVIDSSNVDTSIPENYIVNYTVTDQAGNEQTATRTVQIRVNTTDVPFFEIKGNTSNQTPIFTTMVELGDDFEIATIDAIDNGTIEDQGAENIDAINIPKPTEGTYTIRYFATDNDGNTTEVIETVTVADTTKPNFIVTKDGNNYSESFATTIPFNGTYEAGGIMNIEDISEITENISGVNEINKTISGSYLIMYTVTDQSLKKNTKTITETVTVGPKPINRAPKAIITPATGLDGVAPHTITLDASESNDIDFEDSLSYKWTLPDNTEKTTETITETFTEGEYTIRLEVIDQEGLTNEALVSFVVAENQPPSFTVKNATTPANTVIETTINVGEQYNVGNIVGIDDENLDTVTTNISGAMDIDGQNICFKDDGKEIIYTVTDEKGAIATITETIKTIDNQPPSINYTGPNPITHFRGEDYIPLIVTLTDDDPCVNDITNAISNVVLDNSILGSTNNSVTYVGQDASGKNANPITIPINVINQIPIAGDDNLGDIAADFGNVYQEVLNNDFDPDGEEPTLSNPIIIATFEITQQPGLGATASIANFGTTVRGIQITTGTQTGTTSLQYTIIDNDGAVSEPATVTFTIVQ